MSALENTIRQHLGESDTGHERLRDFLSDILVRTLERKARRDRPRVLVVEDNEFSRRLLTGALGPGLDILEANCGEAGLAEYAMNAPDMVFLDLDMPGIGGHETLNLIRALDPEAYVVVVTANNFPADVKRAVDHGARGFVAKPYARAKILRYIEDWSRKSGRAMPDLAGKAGP